MKLSVKTLTNEQFVVEVADAGTVLDAKNAIQASKGEAYNSSLQKLIHAGKVLKDESTLEESGVKDGTFLVCMVSKPKVAAPAPAPAAPAPAAPAPAPPAPAPAPAAAPAAAPPAVPAAAPANPFAGPDFEAAVEMIKGMGFPEPDIRTALQAAFGNPDRAVDYLMTGIPAGALAASQRGPAAAPGAAAAAPPGSVVGPTHPLAVLRQHPQFNQLKRLVQSNPASLPSVLSSIGAASPELLTLIQGNTDAFVALMQEPIEGGAEDDGGEDDGEDDGMGGEEGEGGEGERTMMMQMAQMVAGMTPEQRAAMAAQTGMPLAQLNQLAQLGQMLAASGGLPGGGAPGGHAGGGAPGGGGGGRVAIQLTTDEAAAVERLIGLGFPKGKALEAFLACDKNEEMAANYLLENMGE